MLKIPPVYRVALLIDADNAQLSRLSQILEIAEHYGHLEIRRAYGDWKQPPLSAFCDDVRNPNIDRVQVDRVAKDTSWMNHSKMAVSMGGA